MHPNITDLRLRKEAFFAVYLELLTSYFKETSIEVQSKHGTTNHGFQHLSWSGRNKKRGQKQVADPKKKKHFKEAALDKCTSLTWRTMVGQMNVASNPIGRNRSMGLGKMLYEEQERSGNPCASLQLCASDSIFYESFDDDFEGRWIVSEKEDYKG
ncbi:hypothetical protein AAG906_025625 [Vitis piasezkii]